MSGEMSTRGLQQALARIYTDAPVREAFLRGDEAPLFVYELSPDDLMHLRELRENSPERLKFFSGLLANKQFNLISALLPLTYAALGTRLWNQALSAYGSAPPAEAMLTPSTKAICFLKFLEDYLDKLSPKVDLLKDIVVYERCKLTIRSAFQMQSSSQIVIRGSTNDDSANLYPLVQRPFLSRLFDYDLTKIIRSLTVSASLPGAQPSPTLILFYRHWKTGSINTAKISRWVEDLLNLCDGQTQAAYIVTRLNERLRIGVEQSPSGCKQLLYHLERWGVVALQSCPSNASTVGDL